MRTWFAVALKLITPCYGTNHVSVCCVSIGSNISQLQSLLLFCLDCFPAGIFARANFLNSTLCSLTYCTGFNITNPSAGVRVTIPG